LLLLGDKMKNTKKPQQKPTEQERFLAFYEDLNKKVALDKAKKYKELS